MSLVLPCFYHWSPAEYRAAIKRRGLKPTTPTAVPVSTPIPGYAARIVDPEASALMVCLGTSPSHAWCLSGGIWAERGSTWDLWQVTLDVDDEVHPLPFFGYRLDEVRVSNRIPKRRVWYVASRTIQEKGPR